MRLSAPEEELSERRLDGGTAGSQPSPGEQLYREHSIHGGIFNFLFLGIQSKLHGGRLATPMRPSHDYGIGFGPGTGGTPQMADAEGGRDGVGIRKWLPWVEAFPPVMH